MKNPLQEAKRWYDQAWNDWEFTIWLSQEDRFFDKGCFIAQQAAEKALKSCLFAVGERFVPAHSTYELATKLKSLSGEFVRIEDATRRLDRFYIPTRYPNGLPGGVPYQCFTREDLSSAVADGEKIMQMCQTFLAGKGVTL